MRFIFMIENIFLFFHWKVLILWERICSFFGRILSQFFFFTSSLLSETLNELDGDAMFFTKLFFYDSWYIDVISIIFNNVLSKNRILNVHRQRRRSIHTHNIVKIIISCVSKKKCKEKGKIIFRRNRRREKK